MPPAPAPERSAIVIGAGFIGLASAHALMNRGMAVTVIDPGGEPGRPSEGNAGWIAHTDIMPLASPKVWRHLPRWLADPLGPLAIRPAYLPALAPWMLRFIAASRPSRIEAGITALRAIQAEALPAWKRLMAAHGLEGHLRERANLTVWTRPQDVAEAAPMLERQKAFGIPFEIFDGPGLRRLEPALGDAIVGGALYPGACHVSDPRLLLAALHAALLQRGATLLKGRAIAISPAKGNIAVTAELADGSGTVKRTAGNVVIAAGAWSRALARQCGDRIPLDTERGYNATFPSGTIPLRHPVSFEGQGFVTTPLDTGDRIGGAVEFAGLAAAPNFARIDALLARLKRLVPSFRASAADARLWMGFRPSIPDSLPVIGPSRMDARIVYAFGHGHYGLTQAAVTAEMVAALLSGERPAVDAAPFRATRF